MTIALLGFSAAPLGAGMMIVCPKNLAADAAEPFQLVGRPPGRPAPLEGLQLIEGEPGSEQAPAPVTLAPGSEHRQGGAIIGVWNIAGPRPVPLLVVCRYVGAKAYLRAILPDAITTCKVSISKLTTEAHCR